MMMMVMMMMMTMMVLVIWLTDKRHVALFSAGTFVRDPDHCESLTHYELGLNLRRT